MSRGGWWRRNRWGLLALVPVLLLAAGLRAGDVYQVFWKRQPRAPVGPAADGWVTYGKARMRLVALAPATDLAGFGGAPFTPPAGVTAWKATVAFEATKDAGLGACRLLLEDEAGRTYGPSPNELSGARLPYPSCTPDGDPPPTSYQSVIYFATPTAARPAAVRIVLTLVLPRYARLPAEG